VNPDFEGVWPDPSLMTPALRRTIDDEALCKRVATPTIVCPARDCGGVIGWLLRDRSDHVLVYVVRNGKSTQRVVDFLDREPDKMLFGAAECSNGHETDLCRPWLMAQAHGEPIPRRVAAPVDHTGHGCSLEPEPPGENEPNGKPRPTVPTNEDVWNELREVRRQRGEGR